MSLMVSLSHYHHVPLMEPPQIELNQVLRFKHLLLGFSRSLWLPGIAILHGIPIVELAPKCDKTVSFLLQVIKLQGWEAQFLKNVENARGLEYIWIWRYMYVTSFGIFVAWFTPLGTCVAIFTVCTYLGSGLSPGAAFTIIATVRITQEPLRLFPQTLVNVSQVYQQAYLQYVDEW